MKSIGKRINEYITETIETKRNLKKQIALMKEQNDKLMETIKERDLNQKDIIKERDMYKTKLRQLKIEFTEYKRESQEIIDELTKELKKVSK